MLVAVPDIPEGGADLVAKNIPLASAAVPTVAFAHKLAAEKANDAETTKASGLSQATLQIARPHPLNTASIAQLGQGFLNSAKLTAWQYLIVDGGSPHAVAETRWKESTLSLSMRRSMEFRTRRRWSRPSVRRRHFLKSLRLTTSCAFSAHPASRCLPSGFTGRRTYFFRSTRRRQF